MNYVCLTKTCSEYDVTKDGGTEPLGDVICGICQELMSETTDDPITSEVDNADPSN